VLVGADASTANGDVAQQIGTYTLAVLAEGTTFPFTSRRRFRPSREHADGRRSLSRKAQRLRRSPDTPDAVGNRRRGRRQSAFDVTPGGTRECALHRKRAQSRNPTRARSAPIFGLSADEIGPPVAPFEEAPAGSACATRA